MILKWDIEPIGAPRMNRSDAWKGREVVERYHVFRDLVNIEMKKVDYDWEQFDTLCVDFYVPMSKSWTLGKKSKMDLLPHTEKPDTDNLVKALLDAIFRDLKADDKQVHTFRHVGKFWTTGKGRIVITI